MCVISVVIRVPSYVFITYNYIRVRLRELSRYVHVHVEILVSSLRCAVKKAATPLRRILAMTNWLIEYTLAVRRTPYLLPSRVMY